MRGIFRNITLAAAVVLFILIVLGGVVRVTGSGVACPDWPTCFGQWTPPARPDAFLNYLHRAVALLAGVMLTVDVFLAWRLDQKQWVVKRMLYAAFGLMIIQVLLGGVVVANQRPLLSAIHLGLSLLILWLVSMAAVIAFYLRGDEDGIRLVFRSPFARLSLWVAGGAFLLFVSGAWVAAGGGAGYCSTWPLCDFNSLAGNIAGWANLAHRLMVFLVGIFMILLLRQAWRTQRSQTPILVATTAAAVLFFAQALMGARLVAGFPAYLLVLHEATAVAVWAALAVQVAAVGMAARTAEAERLEAVQISPRRGLLRDFLMLTKPVVVALLLVTTFAGMVIGAQAWPKLPVIFWTLLGGFLAAGGSGAINQYIDREDDVKMQRTQKRPIPDGRLTPGEGLAFGVAITLSSFYIMVAFVNFLAALLTLAGIIYYVLIYSIFLKKATVQNIVIGGGAGAIPPLVGWAAATGHLNIPSLFLFAIVFMWTPPHFWALALVRRKDYARAGVPMLPVIRGERETRWQILLYTIELVALSLMLPLFGLGGSIYLVGAAVLGGLLLYSAWKVYRQEGNKVAWKMYRHSSMYLAFLFLVLMLDRLIIH